MPAAAAPPIALPLRFEPVLKRTLWGGRRLGTLLGKAIGQHDDVAESWEIVDHGEDQSRVVDGPLAGRTLGSLVAEYPQWLLGQSLVRSAGGSIDRFPLLLKYLDCNRDLSVQVHPDDAYGATLDPPDLGKTEAWVVVAAEPGSQIYAGLRSGLGRDDLDAAMRDGRTDEVLHRFEPAVGDCVFIPAGTVHALGAGLVIAEIQQSSDTTFRLFDWNRTDAAGNARPLHLQQSLGVTDYDRGPVGPVQTPGSDGGTEKLVECDKFTLRRISSTATVGGDGRCHLLTLPAGTARLTWPGGRTRMTAGDSVLLPAAMDELQVNTDSAVLWMTP